MFTFTIFSIGPSLLNVLSTFLTYIGSSILFNLNPYFLVNSELITNFIAPLSNNASTITPSCVSILSNPIFTVTSLNMSLLSRLHIDVFSTTLESIANLLLLRSSQELLDLLPYLNYFVCYFLPLPTSIHILVFSPPQFCSLFSYFCSSLLNIQISHSSSSSYFSYLPLWYIDCIVQTLPSDWDVPLLYLFSILLLSEQVLLEPTVERFLAFLAKLGAMAIAAMVSLYSSTLEWVSHCLFAPLASLLLSYFPSNSYLRQLPCYTIT